MTQCDRILKYMEDFGSITSREAVVDLGIMRLASRVHELRRNGYNIEDAFETAKNRYGEPTTYKRYWINKENGNGRMDKASQEAC